MSTRKLLGHLPYNLLLENLGIARFENVVAKEEITLYLFPKKALIFTCLRYKPFENTVGKGEIARNEQFLLFPQYFPTIWEAFCYFCHI